MAPIAAVNPIYQAQPASPFAAEPASSPVAPPSYESVAAPASSTVAPSEPVNSATPYVTPESSPATPYATPVTSDQAETKLSGGGRTRCKHCNHQLQYRKKSRRKLIA